MLRNLMPYSLNAKLFGDRRRYGIKADADDPDWKNWQQIYTEAYRVTQKENSAGQIINNAGYEILQEFDFNGKKIAEIGPGGGYHFRFIRPQLAEYIPIDVNKDFLKEVSEKAKGLAQKITPIQVSFDQPQIPIADNSLDYFLSFYSMEHLHPLDQWVAEIFRVLKPGGQLVGAIPTEGGLLWGLGRYFTSRRTLTKNYGVNIDKIVCWEHPNFCDQVISALKQQSLVKARNWPLRFVPADFNLLQIITAKKPTQKP